MNLFLWNQEDIKVPTIIGSFTYTVFPLSFIESSHLMHTFGVSIRIHWSQNKSEIYFMADLKSWERKKLEKFFQMEGGYVLDFSNRTFDEFIQESINVNPYDSKYDRENASGSKANRLRGIIDKENSNKVAKLIMDLAEYRLRIMGHDMTQPDKALYDEVVLIADKLRSEKMVEGVDAFQVDWADKNFGALAKAIRECIEKNEPQHALDRLHTFVFLLLRDLCRKHKIEYSKQETLHSVFGKYVKHLIDAKIVETAMSQRILKTSISLLDAFNDVRNNKSFAHPNEFLNYDESLLIVNSVANSVKFIQAIEDRIDLTAKEVERKRREIEIRGRDELPF